MDNVPGNASMHSHVQCSSAPGRICVHAIHPGCATVDHLRVEDNLFAASRVAVVSLRSISKMKDVGGEGEHPRLEDIVQIHSSVPLELECAMGAGILCPGHLHELLCPQ